MEKTMNIKKRAAEINLRLKERYPLAQTPLAHQNAFQLLVATILSAQCTDKQVNKVTPALFERFPTPLAFVEAPLPELEQMIYSTGFYKNKAQNIKGAADVIINRFNGEVPRTLAELTLLPGVGRKTANVVLNGAFDVPGMVVDTHVGRLSRRLGLTAEKDATKVEFDLMKLFLPEDWAGLSLRLIFLGREICFARKPQCAECFLNDICPAAGKA